MILPQKFYYEKLNEVMIISNKHTKNLEKELVKISKVGRYESLCLVESVMGSSYSIWNVVWISKEASVLKIQKEELFRRVSYNTQALVLNVKQKLKLISERIINVHKTFNLRHNLPISEERASFSLLPKRYEYFRKDSSSIIKSILKDADNSFKLKSKKEIKMSPSQNTKIN